MPSSKKPRKKYRPKPCLVDPVGALLESMSIVRPDDVVKLLIGNHEALAALTRGNGTTDHWRTVCGALNIAVVLDEQVYGKAYHDDLKAALEAHAACGVRKWNGGNFGYSGPQLQAVNLAFDIHDEQVRRATVGEIGRAVVETKRRERDPNHRFTVRQRAAEQKAAA